MDAATIDDFGRCIERGLARRRQRDFSGAIAQFRDACALRPGSIGAQCELAFTQLQAGALDAAEAQYRAVLQADPAGSAALTGFGLVARRRGENARSLEYFREAAEREPGHAGIRCELAFALRLLDRLDEAEAQYRRAIDADQATPSALQGLSAIALARGQTDAAIVFAQKACAIDPADIDGRVALSALYRELGRPAEAAALLGRILAIAPDHAGAWLEQGFLLRARHDRASALTAFQRAAALDRGRGLAEVAAELLSLGKPGEAQDAFSALLASHPDHFAALTGLAEIAVLAGDADAGIALCDTAIAQHPGKILPWRQKCRALAQAGRSEAALHAADELCALLPDSLEAATVRLDIMRTSGRRAEAEAVLRRAPLAGAGSFAAWFETLATRLEFFDFGGAAAMLRRPPPLRPSQRVSVLCAEARLADLQWRVADAIHAYEQAVAIDATDPGTHHQLARLWLLQANAERASRHLHLAMRLSASTLRLRGESPNLSQTLIGQLLNEMRLEPEQTTQSARLADAAAERQVEALRGILGPHPTSTPPALWLMRALRQAGALAAPDRTAEDAPAAIPRRIVQYRDEARPPEDLASRLRGWMETHLGYQVCRFDRAAAIDYLAPRHDAYLTAYLRARDPAQASDLFRLAYLFHEGGFWIAAEQRCIGHLSAIADPAALLIVDQDPHAALGGNLVGCVAGEAVVGRALELAVQSLLRGDADNVWLATGPGLFTRAFAGAFVAQGECWRDWLGRRRVLDRAELAEVCWPEPGLRRMSASAHAGAKSRRRPNDAALQEEQAQCTMAS